MSDSEASSSHHEEEAPVEEEAAPVEEEPTPVEAAPAPGTPSAVTSAERANQDSKFGYKAPESNRHTWQPKKWEDKAFTGVSPFDFAMQQKRKQKEMKEKEAAAKAQMYRYQGKPNEDVISANRKEQHERELQSKQKARETRSNLKDVNITVSFCFVWM